MHASPIDTSTRRSINQDILCGRCAYNLRGLSVDGRCPECGAAVAASLGGERLGCAFPAWLAMMQAGWRLSGFGMATVLLMLAMLPLLAAAGAESIAGGWWLWGCAVMAAMGWCANCAGWWMVAAAEKPNPRLQPTRGRRATMRTCAVVGALVILSLALPALQNRFIWVAAMFLALLGVLAVAVGMIEAVGYITILSQRLPEERMAKLADRCEWLLVMVLGVAGIVALSLVMACGADLFRVALMLLTLAAGAGMLIYLYVLGRFTRALAAEIEMAKKRWACPDDLYPH